MLFYGLQNMTSESAPVKRILAIIAAYISTETSLVLSTQGLSMCFFGMKSMSFNNPDVKLIYQSLTRILFWSDAKLESQSISMIIISLTNKCMDSEIEQLVGAVVQKIRDDTQLKLDSRILIGMQEMSTDYVCVRELLSLLSTHMRRDTANIDVLTVCKIMCSMAWMDNAVEELRGIIDVLNASIVRILKGPPRYSKITSSWNIGRMLYGLQCWGCFYADTHRQLTLYNRR
jgi:hypothetical protein